MSNVKAFEILSRNALQMIERICGRYENGDIDESEFEVEAFKALDRLINYQTALEIETRATGNPFSFTV